MVFLQRTLKEKFWIFLISTLLLHIWYSARVGGPKTLKNYILKSFSMSKVELKTLFQQVQTQYGNHSSILYSVS